MKSFKKSIIIFLVILIPASWIILSSCGKEKQAELARLIPRKVLFGNPARMNPKISPDGTMISYLAPSNNVMNIWVVTIGNDDNHPVTGDSLRGIFDYYWTADNKHMIYLKDKLGNEFDHLFITNIETGETTELTPYDSVSVRIVQYDYNFPDEIIISMNRDNPGLFDAYRLYLATGDIEKIAQNPGNNLSWIADADLSIRAGHFVNQDGGYSLMVRRDEQSDWKTLIEWGPEEAIISAGIGFSRDGRSLYIIDSRGVNAGRLVKMEIVSGKMDVLAEDPEYDVSGTLLNPYKFEIQAAVFEKDRQEIVILDDSITEDIEILRRLHPGDLAISGRDRADDTWLVSFSSDSGPITYYAFDRATNDATLLFHRRPELNNYEFAPMEPVSFKSSDGLVIHGFITYPLGQGRKNLPMVLKVHGGPWVRDVWGFDPETQWLANRGYAVLQINYRGSSGYGKEFLNAGTREWGRKVHNDLVEAVNWAIKEGIADPKKIAIYGYSFGGYQALLGAALDGDLFCCAVAASAPSDLLSYINSIPPQWRTMLAIIYRRMGNPVRDEQLLKEQSPLYKADQIQIPILIAHGSQDPRVKQAEADQIVEALKENGVEYEYLLFDDEGHGYIRPENRLKYFTAAEKFLAKHLGGRFESESAD